MTTSRETQDLQFPALRALVEAAQRLPLEDRLTLLKGLVPSVARELSPEAFDAFAAELRLKGARFYEAESHPGEGRAERLVPGEREIEHR